MQLAVRAMREGAYDFIEKPFNTRHLAEMAKRAIDRRQLVLENRELRAAAGKRDDVEARLPGRTPVMIDLRYRLRAVAAHRRRPADRRRNRYRQGGGGPRHP